MRLAIAATLLLVAGSALASPLDDKKCIFAAAAKLPILPGLTITGSKAIDLTPPVATKLFLDSLPDIETAHAIFGRLDPQGEALLVASPERWREILGDRINPDLAPGADVSIVVKAAGQDATYGFACLLVAGSVITTSRGLLE